ncbi:MAG: hypothetical protein ACP5HJ_03445, partial [Candidatus Micrarchaeia archaeon]
RKGVGAKKAKIVVASEEKRKVYEKIRNCKSVSEAYEFAKSLKENEKEIALKIIKMFPLKETLKSNEEFEAFMDAKDYIEKKTSLSVEVEEEEKSKEEKAKQALPMKPAIIIY